MAQDIQGNVTGKVRFNIDKKSWDNLALFQKKLTSIKRQMSGLKGTIKVNAIVNDIKKVNKAVSDANSKTNNKYYNSHVVAFQKQQAKIEKQTIKDDEARAKKMKNLRWRVTAENWKAAERERKAKARADLKAEKDELKRREMVQKKWNKRRIDQGKREAHIQYRQQGMQNTLVGRFGETLGGAKVSAVQAQMEQLNKQYRRNQISAKSYNQSVTALTQAQVRSAIATRNNAMSMRSLRQELVQATAAYTAFSAGANVFNTGKEFDSLDASMRLFAKDDAGVAKTMAYIRGESERLGINLQQATEGFTKFSIVARNKMSESQRMEFFSGFSEYATVMQIDQYRFQRSMMAIQQMLSKSKISSEELRLQLA